MAHSLPPYASASLLHEKSMVTMSTGLEKRSILGSSLIYCVLSTARFPNYRDVESVRSADRPCGLGRGTEIELAIRNGANDRICLCLNAMLECLVMYKILA